LAGKDLELDVILKFLIFVAPRIVALILPLTILLASIMVFGSFSENYEFAAMKSTGISLQRAMKSLSVFVILLAGVSFFFANTVIPAAEYNFFNLRRNIAKVKPAFAIAEGQFNQLAGINIKVANKSGDRGQFLEDVIIHQKKGTINGNYTVIKSKTGEFISLDDSNIIQLVLIDGNYYDELQPADYIKRTKNRPQVKSTFDTYTINIDISTFNVVDFEKKDITTKHNMLGISDLNKTIDSLALGKKRVFDEFSKTMQTRSNHDQLNTNYTSQLNDSLNTDIDILSLFKTNKKIQLTNLALSSVKTIKRDLKTKSKSFEVNQMNLNKHIVAFYDKFALGLSCIILFFVGAPLGALIRKGGIGLPLVIAILIFLTYHFIGLFAKNSSEDSSLDPVLATWVSSLIMLPFSIYLTNRATKDRALLDLDSMIIPLKNWVNKTQLSKRNIADSDLVDTEYSKEIENYEQEKLIDIVKNYRYYGLEISHKNSALQVLNNKGVSTLELRTGGNLTNEVYESALRYQNEFEDYSKLALWCYYLCVLLGVGGAILNNNGFSILGISMIILGFMSLVVFLITYQKTIINQSNFYRLIDKKIMSNALVLIIVGIPLFLFYRIYFKKKINEDLKQIN
jgi:lipopolysaccharide export system permease protein